MPAEVKVDRCDLEIEQSSNLNDVIRVRNVRTGDKILLDRHHIDNFIGALMKMKRELGMAPSKHTEEQRKTIVFKMVNAAAGVVCRAWVKESPACFGEGKSQNEAFGDLARHHPEVFNVEFNYGWHVTPPPARKEETPQVQTPPLPLVPQKGMMVQFHERVYPDTEKTFAVAALVIGVGTPGLTLKLFQPNGNEEVRNQVCRGGEGKPGTWEFIPCKVDETQAVTNQFIQQAVAATQQRRLANEFAAATAARAKETSCRQALTPREKLVAKLREQGETGYADRVEEFNGSDSPKLLAFPTADVTCEVDERQNFWIADHTGDVVQVVIEDMPALIDALQKLLAATQAAR